MRDFFTSATGHGGLYEEWAITRHVRRMRKLYKQRRQVLLEIVDRKLGKKLEWVESDGGMHSVFRLPEGMSDQNVCQKATDKGLGIRPLSGYYSSDNAEQG